ncbi:MAG TPA: histidine phosphatase family protein [Candidatus Limnocylindrales bacterium]|nr:histidine phosphatase family protein [Candidatus Limnocylindrales bacterium]
MLTLVLTRHGLTPRSKPEQHLGQTIDVPLSDEGREQATRLAERLDCVAFEEIFSSPLARARETAAIVAGERPVRVDPRLLEMDYGEWEGLTYGQIEERDEVRRRAWERDPAVLRCPGGESGNDVAARAGAFLVQLLEEHVAAHGPRDTAERPVLAVAHSSVNRILACVALGLPIREFRERFTQDQVNVTVLRFEHGDGPSDARLLLLNDVEHVRGPGVAPWE